MEQGKENSNVVYPKDAPSGVGKTGVHGCNGDRVRRDDRRCRLSVGRPVRLRCGLAAPLHAVSVRARLYARDTWESVIQCGVPDPHGSRRQGAGELGWWHRVSIWSDSPRLARKHSHLRQRMVRDPVWPGVYRRWRRRRAGRCAKCGYDLRGLPPAPDRGSDSVCPECGKEI